MYHFDSLRPVRSRHVGALIRVIAMFLTVIGLMAHPARGQTKGGDDLRAKTQNPIGALISVPLKSTFDFGAADGSAYFLNIQPVIPFTVGQVNLINRVILPIISVPDSFPATPALPTAVSGDGATGLGDINYSLFLSPAAPGKVIWGLGPSLSFPSATDDQLGTGKWSAGPTAVILTQPQPWTLGALVRQLWSYAGDDDRGDVSQFLVEPFVNYNLSQGWYLISDMVITANWEAESDNRWTVPLGGGVGKLFKIGNQPINARIEAYGNAVKPENGPDWNLSFTLQLLFPK